MPGIGSGLGIGIGSGRRRPSGAVLPPKVLAEGDSITQGTTSSPYADRWSAAHPTVAYANHAIGGAQTGSPGDVAPTNTLYARQAAALSYAPTVMSVFIGANDLGSDTTGYLTNLWGFTDPIRATGCKIIICTVLPRMVGGSSSTVSGWETKRGNLNTALRAAKGTKFDDIVDFDTCPMGVAGAESNGALYEDGLHPISAGQALLARVYSTVLNHMLGIPNEPLDFAFAPQAAATADTDYDSANYTVTGLYSGESRNYSVSGGAKVSKNNGSFVTNGTGTVVNGDMLKVRNHSSATAATQTDVVLTVGASTATYSVTTAGAGSRDWIPTDLGSKLKLWLRPEGISGADASQMATWPDNSGNSVTVTGTGNSSQPIVVAAGLNSLKTVKFDGPLGSKFTLPGGFLGSRTSSATLFVSKNVTDGARGYFNAPITEWGPAGDEYYPYTNGSVYSRYGINARHQTPDIAPNLDTWRFASFHAGASDWRFYVDGTLMDSSTGETYALGTSPVIGVDFDGQVAEVVDCTNSLTTTERQLVEGYLAWKFGLQANLPGAHPYAGAKPTI